MVPERPEEDVTYKQWSKLNLQLKTDLLAGYLIEPQSLLFIDDAHKLTGRKPLIARKCLMSTKLWLMTLFVRWSPLLMFLFVLPMHPYLIG